MPDIFRELVESRWVTTGFGGTVEQLHNVLKVWLISVCVPLMSVPKQIPTISFV